MRGGSARGGIYGPDPRVAAWKSPSSMSPAVIVFFMCLLTEPVRLPLRVYQARQKLDVWVDLSSEYSPSPMAQALSKFRKERKYVTNQRTKRFIIVARILLSL